MSLYQSNGDLVKIPQNTTLYKKEFLVSNYVAPGIAVTNSLPVVGFIFDIFTYKDHTWYEMLIDNECWCADADQVYSTGV